MTTKKEELTGPDNFTFDVDRILALFQNLTGPDNFSLGPPRPKMISQKDNRVIGKEVLGDCNYDKNSTTRFDGINWSLGQK